VRERRSTTTVSRPSAGVSNGTADYIGGNP
jgi:hypothetical protein